MTRKELMPVIDQATKAIKDFLTVHEAGPYSIRVSIKLPGQKVKASTKITKREEEEKNGEN